MDGFSEDGETDEDEEDSVGVARENLDKKKEMNINRDSTEEGKLKCIIIIYQKKSKKKKNQKKIKKIKKNTRNPNNNHNNTN